MTDFIELRYPAQEIKGNNKGKWYVLAPGVMGIAQALIADGSNNLGQISFSGDNDEFYFTDEIITHIHAEQYYIDNKVPYPYKTELENLLRNKYSNTTGIVVQSKPMTF